MGISNKILNETLLQKRNISCNIVGYESYRIIIDKAKKAKDRGYKVYLIYPMVPQEQLIYRTQLRKRQTGQETPTAEKTISNSRKALNNINILSNSHNVFDKIWLLDNSDEKGIAQNIFIMQNNKVTYCDILITFENEVKIMRNCLIINVMFIQNDTLWV